MKCKYLEFEAKQLNGNYCGHKWEQYNIKKIMKIKLLSITV